MSGSVPAPLSDSEKTDVRRFCGYPAYGGGATDDPFYRYSVNYIQLESHMVALSSAELIVCRSKLADLQTLDAAIVASGANLDTAQAAVWVHNKNELADRTRLYIERRRDLCGFLGVPPGPALSGNGGLRVVI